MSLNGLRANGSAAGRDELRDGALRIESADAEPRRGEAEVPAAGAAAPTDVVVHRVWLSGGPDAAAGGRAAIDLITVGNFDEEDRELLRLMLSELVANSVVHGGAMGADDSIDLAISLSPGHIRVECADPFGGFDVPPVALDPARANGYGLQIIDELATTWGTRLGAAGSTWFEFGRGNGLPS